MIQTINPRCKCECHEPGNHILCCGAGSGCCEGAFQLRYDPALQVRFKDRNIMILGDEEGELKKALKSTP